eukprot:CAMPEP_0197859892 /NCGR_PEP_ID=MMETSP1438-20131217/34858_1 /TAXON_ID=1461541 /ORGANISM="Pterosperma sp., Strain CCMP1384" /LENGTH=72 /DNA_ID=CAMNT_0043476563 /DNA_START=19 /DNA_END=237 /DNA_ORIENTATION=+
MSYVLQDGKPKKAAPRFQSFPYSLAKIDINESDVWGLMQVAESVIHMQHVCLITPAICPHRSEQLTQLKYEK